MKFTKKYFLILMFYICSNSVFAQTLTYSNGPISTGAVSNSGVTAPTGYTWSECQNITGNTTETNSILGFDGFLSSTNPMISTRLADDFVVPAGQTWHITSFELYYYQTGYTGTTPPIFQVPYQFYNGDPSLSTSTSVSSGIGSSFSSSLNSDALIYRISNSAVPTSGIPTNTDNKIWKFRANANATLTSGTYWIVFRASTLNDNPISFVPVTINGSRGQATSNAKQRIDFTQLWSNLVDTGNPISAPDFNQDIAFNINYTLTSLSNKDFSKIEAKLFPNPTNDSFILSMSGEVKNNLKSVEIYNFLGQKVKEFSIQESYSIQEMTSGIYFAKLISNSNIELQNIRIIKN